jgi:hydrogenase expression/formation protein HypD
VPAVGTSLEIERSRGALVEGVQSAWEAVELAKARRDKEVVFLAVGFETTAPGTAIAVEMARKGRIGNFSAYVSHKTIPPALAALGKDKDLGIQGFLLPGHVSAIIGLRGYESAWKDIRLPGIISGFEPLDILVSIHRLVRAINEKKPVLENEYSRVVHPSGNPQAQKVLLRVFETGDGCWRGLGLIKESALVLRKPYRAFDAAVRFGLKRERSAGEKGKGCRCADVVKGKIDPPACPFFRKVCKPETPKGPCMVSREGTCRSFYEYV